MTSAKNVVCVLEPADVPAMPRRVMLGEQLRALAAEPETGLLVVLDEGGGAGEAWLTGAPLRRDLDQLTCPAVVVPRDHRVARGPSERAA